MKREVKNSSGKRVYGGWRGKNKGKRRFGATFEISPNTTGKPNSAEVPRMRDAL